MTTLGLACEDAGHVRAVTLLVDLVLTDRHHWLRDVVESCRTWSGYEPGSSWSKCASRGPIIVDGREIRIHGPIDGKPLEDGARMWREVLLRFVHAEPRPEVVVLVQDGDGRRRSRLAGIDQVRRAASLRWPFPVVAALPEPEVEAWLVAGFEPESALETAALTELTRELSFDPCRESHRLTSHPNDASTDAKLVLGRLCGEDADREAACLSHHERIRKRGQDNGAAEFLDDVERDIVPLFGSRR